MKTDILMAAGVLVGLVVARRRARSGGSGVLSRWQMTSGGVIQTVFTTRPGLRRLGRNQGPR
ncbi:MAG TPA: hypothetical protein VNP92_31575 [Actinophytocola sp.]|nr:hypothetical protein [Actinophytocola sp.]